MADVWGIRRANVARGADQAAKGGHRGPSVGAPYALHVVDRDPETATHPPTATALATGAASAFAPSVVARDGSTRRSIAQIVDHAITISTATNAREPAIASSEYPGPRDRGGGVVRASPLTLP